LGIHPRSVHTSLVESRHLNAALQLAVHVLYRLSVNYTGADNDDGTSANAAAAAAAAVC